MASYSLTPRLISLENRAGEIPMLYDNFFGPCLFPFCRHFTLKTGTEANLFNFQRTTALLLKQCINSCSKGVKRSTLIGPTKHHEKKMAMHGKRKYYFTHFLQELSGKQKSNSDAIFKVFSGI